MSKTPEQFLQDMYDAINQTNGETNPRPLEESWGDPEDKKKAFQFAQAMLDKGWKNEVAN